MIITDNHFIKGDGVEFIPSFKNGKLFDMSQMDSIILHYTSGRDVRKSAKYLSRNDVNASAHIIVGRDGTVIQLVPFNVVSWHSGESDHNGRIGMNNYSIGVEIDNAGILDANGKAWFGTIYPKEEVYIDDDGRKWHKYTQVQLNIIKSICKLLIKKYNIKYILGHEEVSPQRKIDPGKAFPMSEFKNLIKKN